MKPNLIFMKTYHITLFSQNKTSLNNAFLFFLANPETSSIQKYFQKKKQNKIITLLKSPHVNKTAQEQFVNTTYSKQLSRYDYKGKKTFFFLKLVKNNLFADLKIKVKLSLNVKKEKKCYLVVLNPNNFKLKHLSKNFSSQLKKCESFLLNKNVNKTLNLFEIFGGLALKNNLTVWIAQLVRAKD